MRSYWGVGAADITKKFLKYFFNPFISGGYLDEK